MLPRSKSGEPYRLLSGYCPDDHCKTKLYFPAWDSSIECTGCGQRHEKSSIVNIEQVNDPEVALHNMVRNVLLGNVVPKKGTDSTRVLGLSNYHCKLLSPLLTYYGMDKGGKAQKLQSLNRGETFDCAILGDRAFQISPEHIDISGYGRDQTGSVKYLQETVDMIDRFNDPKGELLIPLHADGDGHCLVHAVSRSLIGRELFWHALRVNLKKHFEMYLDKYKLIFCDFIDINEWSLIVDECDPDFVPYDTEPIGLRNIHIFGLCNVLHRPIILLDSLSGLQSSADYSGIFLPALVPPDKCKGKDGKLNKPICIAWSSPGRNHYIPLVGVKGRPLPRIPRWMISKAWGMPQELLNQYVEFDKDDMCTIGGERTLGDKYIERLANAMEEVFMDNYHVHPKLVADMHQYVYKRSGIVGVQTEIVTEATRKSVSEKRLYRCLTCDAITEFTVSPEWFIRGGMLYALAENTHGKLQHNKKYSFPLHGLICSYDPVKDELVPDLSHSTLTQCSWCQGNSVRLVNGDGSIVYNNGDRTKTPAPDTRCNCGFKHYWDGTEYDNLPENLPVELTWGGKTVKETVYWFQYERDTSLNSNAYEIASALVQKHFPGEFGSERLVQSVAGTILKMTAKKEEEYKPISLAGMQPPEEPFTPDLSQPTSPRLSASSPNQLSPRNLHEKTPSKIILTGFKSKTFHKEELTLNEKEKEIKQRVETNAPLQQRRATLEEEKRKHQEEWRAKQQQAAKKEVHTAGKKGPIEEEKAQSLPPTKPTGKKIRVSTSDGRQSMMSLDVAITYQQLQDKIETELNVPKERQKIKYGFPPRELKPADVGKDGDTVPLQHGDKVMVEILPDPNQQKDPQEMDTQYESSQQTRQSWTGGETLQQSVPTDDMMQSLENLSQDFSMALMATISGSDLWTYVQNMPQLFARGGLFYRQVERDLGLADNKHCTLPTLPSKTFRFNAKEDRLELCLEPIGHFPVAPGVDDPSVLSRIATEKLSTTSAASSDQGQVFGRIKAGGSGVVKPGSAREKSSTMVFTGEAHTLSGSTSIEASRTETTRGLTATGVSMQETPITSSDRRLPVTAGTSEVSSTSLEASKEKDMNYGSAENTSKVEETALQSENIEMSEVKLHPDEKSSIDDDDITVTELTEIIAEAKESDIKMETVELIAPASPMQTEKSQIGIINIPTNTGISEALTNETSESSHADSSDSTTVSGADGRPLVAKKLGPGYTVLARETDTSESRQADADSLLHSTEHMDSS
ncbi:deubiquitinating protein VCPIP1-like [Saccoglossus kowalevskii]|uniref:ubiquitinyl hydrolase 1 n=1 Tax=Saccoglossus kowalevskii TaxID=10224 RepID=A0ABM0MY81_SACKO|nr:PREDICTED: deubiquitinating protein VCIP135-like [Saccoglossus kowalevskii]